MAFQRPQGIEWVDYGILAQLILAIFYYLIWNNKYENVIVYFSFILFVAHWLIRTVFNPKYSQKIAG